MHRIACAVLLAAAVTGCGGDESPVHFVDLADGDYVGGAQKTRIEVDGDVLAARVELYLDGGRVATDDLAPFELIWDSTAFAELKHTLQARVYESDGSSVDGRVRIHVDNTAPVILDVPAGAAQGQPFLVNAIDNGEIASTTVVTPQDTLVSTDDPRAVAWPYGCGIEPIEVRVTDRAGWTATRSLTVVSGRVGDIDCDGHLATSLGGRDCNDLSAQAFPGATDPGGTIDLDCDGVPGIDADRDGVASVATGGEDCNDADPAIHGRQQRFGTVRVLADGRPLIWSPGAAAIADSPRGAWELVVNHGGTIYHALGGYGSTQSTATPIATGANEQSIALDGPFTGTPEIAFGRGNQVVMMASKPAWTEHAVIDAGGPVGRIGLELFTVSDVPRRKVAFQVGTRVVYATDESGTWSTRELGDVGATLVEAPQIQGDRVIARTAGGVWSLALGQANVPVGRLDAEDVVGERSGVAIDYDGAFYAINHDGVGAVYRVGEATPTLTLGPVQRLFIVLGRLFVSVEGEPLRTYRVRNGALLSPIPSQAEGVQGVDSHWIGLYFTSPGLVYTHGAQGTVYEADEVEDGVDQNCDGYAF